MTQKQLLQGAGDGTAVPAGYIVENYQDIGSTLVTTSNTNLATRTLTPGVWSISAWSRIDNGSAFGYMLLSISTNGATTIDNSFTNYASGNDSAGFGGVAVSRVVTISTNTPFYLIGNSDAASGARTSRFLISYVRIG